MIHHAELIKEAFMITADFNRALLSETELRLDSSEIISIGIVIYKARVEEELLKISREKAGHALSLVYPAGVDATKCRFCGADVAFIKKALDPGVKPGSHIVDLSHWKVVITPGGEVVTGWESHFAHCSDAKKWGGGKEGHEGRTLRRVRG